DSFSSGPFLFRQNGVHNGSVQHASHTRRMADRTTRPTDGRVRGPDEPDIGPEGFPEVADPHRDRRRKPRDVFGRGLVPRLSRTGASWGAAHSHAGLTARFSAGAQFIPAVAPVSLVLRRCRSFDEPRGMLSMRRKASPVSRVIASGAGLPYASDALGF